MNIRSDIAELLRADVPQCHIARQLHCSPLTVQRTREALGLPAPKTVRVLPTTLEDAFRQYTQPTGDGHTAWSGTLNSGTPVVTFEGVKHSARQLAFRFHHGRQPVGRVTTVCKGKACVAGGCLLDEPMREREPGLARLYAGIFEGAA